MKRYEYNYGKNPEGTLSTISGYATETTNFGETAFGILNKSTRDEENFTTPEVVSSSTATLFSVGNGTDHDSRKNIIELKADGTVYINGVGQYDGTNPGESTNIADEFQGIHDDITGLNEDVDRIDNTIESIHISEDAENLIYTLLVDGQERGTIHILRDQFLTNVSYNEETNNLEFTFIVRDENNEEVEKQINIDMTDLQDIYSAGDGLNLENKQFSVKVDANTQPYIEVSSNGVKVIGIDEKFNTVNQNVTDLTNRVTIAESDIDTIQDELANLEGSGEGSVQDQINDALQSYLPLSGGTLTGSITFESEPAGNVGDAVLYDKQADRLIVVPTTDDIGTKYPSDNYEPIGVVVIPASHDVYGTGECGVMSLKYMFHHSPDTGSTVHQNIRWGHRNTYLSLPNLDQVPIGNTSNGIPTSQDDSGFLPSDNFSGTVCAHDSNAYYNQSRNLIPSPYLSDGSRNPGYYQTTSPLSTSNCLADFDGIGNSQFLWDAATAQSDWRTASSITNSYGTGYSPAACCCWRYHTSGTSQGDWYLPAMGELGYMMTRLKAINEAISKLVDAYGGSYGVPVKADDEYWSSSEFSDYNAMYVNTGNGYVKYQLKSGNQYVRAFLRVLPTSKRIIISGKSDTDLLNAAGSTTSISDILAQVPAPDLSPYATKEEVGSNTYTDSNYLSKETNLTDAVVQLDEEIKATNDNLALEHTNAEATYAKKTDLENYLPLTGGTVTGNIVVGNLNNLYNRVSKSGVDLRDNLSDNPTGVLLTSNSDSTWQDFGTSKQGLNIYDGDKMTQYTNTGVYIGNKTSSDLLNAAGSTTPISDITTQVQAAIVDSAPETLDTLNELAAALGDDPNFATTVTNQIAQKASISGLPSNIVPAILPTPIYSDNYVRIAHQYCAKDDSSGTYGTAQSSFTQIYAATSTTAGVMSATDKAKLDGIDISNYVTLDGEQTITGYKRFTGNIGCSGASHFNGQFYIGNSNLSIGTSNVINSGDNVSDTTRKAIGIGFANNDTFSIRGGGPDDSGFAVICTEDNGNEPLYAAQIVRNTEDGISRFKNIITLMNASGNQKFNNVTATGYSILNGTANEVLTADGDSNTLKTINGQTLLGSGDVDMSEFALKTDLDDYLSAGGGTVVGNISVESIEDTNTLTITNTGINISGKTSNDLITAGGGTVSVNTFATKEDLDGYLPLTGGTLSDQVNITNGSDIVKLYTDSIGVYDSSTFAEISAESISIGSRGDGTNILRIRSGGITILSKSSSDLLHASGGTISIDDLKTQIISDLSAQVSTLQTQITVLTSRIEALETSLTKQEV